MTKWQIRLEWIVLLYFLTYTPYAVITKLLTTVVDSKVGRPLTGLEILPFSLIVSSAFIAVFLALSGWWRVAPRRRVAGIPFFDVRPSMWVAGIGAAMLLIAVPMSYTFPNVSIPTVQLLMRGDVLLIAPLVDIVTGRRVRWYSWLALTLVVIALVLTVRMRGGFDFPAMLIAIVVIYTIGYFLRLAVMTRVAKSDDVEATKRYFVEERIISIPIAIGVLALVAADSQIPQGRELAWGFTQVWTSEAVPLLLVIALCLFLITFFAAMVLLDRRENTYCVPLERSASLLAGTAAAFVLAIGFGAPFPKPVEIFSAVVMIVAVSILAVGPMLKSGKKA
jgi:hypothetical protein